MAEATPSEGLYGQEPDPTQPGQGPGPAPGLLDQIVGVFTDPIALFKKLAVTPTWGWALGATVVASLVLTLAWVWKVNPDEFFRPILERNPNIPAENIDKIIEMQGKFLGVIGVLQVLIVIPAVTFLVALFYWLIGKFTAEATAPRYFQAMSATAVAGLVGLPKVLLITFMCLIKPIGGLTPDKISPTSVGFFVASENLKLGALLHALDLFTFASAVMLFLAARYTLRLKVSGAALCAALTLVLSVGLPVLFAK